MKYDMQRDTVFVPAKRVVSAARLDGRLRPLFAEGDISPMLQHGVVSAICSYHGF
jgi:hypothetical protein